MGDRNVRLNVARSCETSDGLSGVGEPRAGEEVAVKTLTDMFENEAGSTRRGYK